MAVQLLGKVAYFNKGAYNSQTNYEINDVVSYNGSSYVSLNDNNQGNLPTNTNYWSVVAEKGDKGDTGKPFVIEKTYSTIESMVADYDNMNVNDYVMIQGSIEEQENATLWTKREVEVSPYKWAYLADFSGASGITGATPNIHIGNVTEGNEPSVTRRSGSSNENPILDFVLKTGAKGDTGATGNGISSIEKTSTSGLVDTYTITFTNGTSTTIEVTNGRGIVSIAKTGTVDYVDTYTITYNDGTTSTFEVTNSEVTEEEFDDVVNELNYLYDDLPKVEGEGTNLTLDNTRKGKMSNVLRGNTSQFSTSGKNLLNTSNLPQQVRNQVTFTPVYEDGLLRYIDVNGTASDIAYYDYAPQKYQEGTYIVSGCPGEGSNNTYKSVFMNMSTYEGVNDFGSGVTKTISQDDTNTNFSYRIRISSGYTANHLKFYPMVRLASITDDTYEPYTNGASPKPDYPQDVDVVSGDNSVVVCGEQLFQDTYIGEPSDSHINAVLPQGTYTIASCDSNNFGTNIYFKLFDKNGNIIRESGHLTATGVNIQYSTNSNSYYGGGNFNKITFTIDNDYQLNISLLNSDNTRKVMLVKGSTENRVWQPYQSNIYNIDLPTENKFDILKITENTYLSYDGTTGSSSVTNMSDYIQILPSKPCTISYTYTTLMNTSQRSYCWYTENKTFISGNTYFPFVPDNIPVTLTAPSNAKYIRFAYDKNCTNIQLQQSSRATPYGTTPIELCKIGDYQDYIYKDNGKWYKHSEIGKVVLNGSETYDPSSTNTSGKYRIAYKGISNIILTPPNASTKGNILCDYFEVKTANQTYQCQQGISVANNGDIQIYNPNNEIGSVNVFKTWLSTHNMSVYYILTTPTNTEITDQTLIAQLDNFEKAISYNTQTNISQENNDLPFIISASAFMSLKYIFGNLETRVAELEG